MSISCLGLFQQAKLSLAQPPSSCLYLPLGQVNVQSPSDGLLSRQGENRSIIHSLAGDTSPLSGVQSQSVLGAERASAEPTPGRHWAEIRGGYEGSSAKAGAWLLDFLSNYFICTEQEESNSIIQADTLNVIIYVMCPAP